MLWNGGIRDNMKNKILLFFIVPLLISCEEITPVPEEKEVVNLGEYALVNVHTSLQQGFLNENDLSTINKYASGVEELSRPKATVLSFQNVETKNNYYIDISKNSDFSNSKRYTSDIKQISVYNLEIGTKYYWRVVTDSYTTNVSTFQTLDNGIRNIYIDGITNARDIGGYLVNNGQKRIKQGLIYRTGRLNISWKDQKIYQISEQGIDTMRNDLRIRSEIDLRRAGDGETSYIQNSVLGRDINYFDCRINYESSNYMTYQKSGIRAMFNALVNTENLPAFFHCDIGTDRTGANAFILGALLGKNERDLYIDYLFSNFGNIGSGRTLASINGKISALKNYEGTSLQEKAINYLVSIGVSKTKLLNFIDYCLEDA